MIAILVILLTLLIFALVCYRFALKYTSMLLHLLVYSLVFLL